AVEQRKPTRDGGPRCDELQALSSPRPGGGRHFCATPIARTLMLNARPSDLHYLLRSATPLSAMVCARRTHGALTKLAARHIDMATRSTAGTSRAETPFAARSTT